MAEVAAEPRRPKRPRTARPCAASAPLIFVLAVVLLLAGLGPSLATNGANAAPSELIPAYFPPEGFPDAWTTMCESAPAGSTVILNPDDGPVKRQAALYAPPIEFCQQRGDHVIGYVFTKYGKRSLTAVERAIAHYYSWYPAVEGIFLDEMAETPSAKLENYYRQLASYVHERGGLVVGNPGDTATTSWQLAAVNQVVTFEGSATGYSTYEPPGWVSAAQPSQIANIVFGASEAQMESDCVKATEDNAGSVYVTNLPERPNPYQQLPSYWTAEVSRC